MFDRAGGGQPFHRGSRPQEACGTHFRDRRRQDRNYGGRPAPAQTRTRDRGRASHQCVLQSLVARDGDWPVDLLPLRLACSGMDLKGVKNRAENYSILVVRWQSRRGHELLCLCLQKLKDRKDCSLWRGRSRNEGNGNDRDISDRRARIYSPKRRATIHLLASHIVSRELRNPAGSRRVVGEALRRRRETKMRLAQRPVWRVLANRSYRFGQAVE